ncbi:MAG: tripartite tricarboxylate transporter substrate binding protein [Paucibacter sp.]|nr:tripartite tricarboxylate transporter substrate binding protein [Roseateles sp.]
MSSFTRRKTLANGLVVAASGWVSTMVWAQSWPTKSIRLVVPFPPGGATDSIARLIADALAPRLEQTVTVENKPGAASMIGVATVVKAPPDGYTLLVSGASSYTLVPALRSKMAFDVTQDLAPVALVTYAPLVVVTGADKPYQRLDDVLALAKAKPRSLNYSTYGPGSQPHLAAELLADAAGVELEPVPYKGSADALIGVVRGDVDIGIETISAASALIKARKLRALAVTNARRSTFLPQVPGLEELNLAKAAIQGFYALAAPAATPAAVVQRLVKEVTEIMATTEARAKCAELSLEAVTVGPEGLRSIMTTELARYRELNKRLKISMD